MDKLIKEVLNKIISNGYDAYLVGGYVRDKLLGINSNDIDIATNMPFKDVKELFKYDIEYNEYYSIKFKLNNYNISITTFRKELEYENNKPIKIEYTSNIEEDYLRRDFTINAIYMDVNENIIDLHNCLDDLNNKVINVIGDINIRLNEDNTRILRALRFMSMYDFKLSEELKQFILNNKHLIVSINYNKKKEELDKIFKSNGYKKFLNFVKDNKLEDVFEFHINKVEDYDNYLDVWKSLNVSNNYIFTKKEKNYLLNVK